MFQIRKVVIKLYEDEVTGRFSDQQPLAIIILMFSDQPQVIFVNVTLVKKEIFVCIYVCIYFAVNKYTIKIHEVLIFIRVSLEVYSKRILTIEK